ncbi:MAG: 2,3,4,5-tetrahydropyridine-2,6-dicarboxylate N-succinyltransferase, partial [Saprospiraceae bacterium]
MQTLQDTIESAWEDRALLQDISVQKAIRDCIELINNGELRVATKLSPGQWQVNEWVKKAITLYFPIQTMETIEIGP